MNEETINSRHQKKHGHIERQRIDTRYQNKILNLNFIVKNFLKNKRKSLSNKKKKSKLIKLLDSNLNKTYRTTRNQPNQMGSNI